MDLFRRSPCLRSKESSIDCVFYLVPATQPAETLKEIRYFRLDSVDGDVVSGRDLLVREATRDFEQALLKDRR